MPGTVATAWLAGGVAEAASAARAAGTRADRARVASSGVALRREAFMRAWLRVGRRGRGGGAGERPRGRARRVVSDSRWKSGGFPGSARRGGLAHAAQEAFDAR